MSTTAQNYDVDWVFRHLKPKERVRFMLVINDHSVQTKQQFDELDLFSSQTIAELSVYLFPGDREKTKSFVVSTLWDELKRIRRKQDSDAVRS